MNKFFTVLVFILIGAFCAYVGFKIVDTALAVDHVECSRTGLLNAVGAPVGAQQCFIYSTSRITGARSQGTYVSTHGITKE